MHTPFQARKLAMVCVLLCFSCCPLECLDLQYLATKLHAHSKLRSTHHDRLKSKLPSVACIAYLHFICIYRVYWESEVMQAIATSRKRPPCAGKSQLCAHSRYVCAYSRSLHYYVCFVIAFLGYCSMQCRELWLVCMQLYSS